MQVWTMNNVELNPGSEYYRGRAMEMLTLAGDAPFDDTQAMLVQLALEYQKLAVSAATIEHSGRTSNHAPGLSRLMTLPGRGAPDRRPF